MKVILKKTVAGLGRNGEVVEVTDAYARNYLLPRQLVGIATTAVQEQQRQRQAHQTKKSAQDQAAEAEAQRRLTHAVITLPSPASDHGRLFAAVKQRQIVSHIESTMKLSLPNVTCHPSHIKNTGRHAVTLRWSSGREVPVVVVIAAIGQPAGKL